MARSGTHGGARASTSRSARGLVATVTVLVVCVVAGVVAFAVRGEGGTLTATTDGTVVSGDDISLGANRDRCDATISYTVDGEEYTFDGVLDGTCDSSAVTVHYDPDAPAAADTDGPSVAPLVLTGLFALLSLGALAALVVQLRDRRRRRAAPPRAPGSMYDAP